MLWPTGAAIGLVEEAEFAEKTFELQEEDLLVLYTDGVTEAINLQGNEQFGTKRLAEVIQQNDNLPAEGLTNKIREALNNFTQGSLPEDDITLMVSRVS